MSKPRWQPAGYTFHQATGENGFYYEKDGDRNVAWIRDDKYDSYLYSKKVYFDLFSIECEPSKAGGGVDSRVKIDSVEQLKDILDKIHSVKPISNRKKHIEENYSITGGIVLDASEKVPYKSVLEILNRCMGTDYKGWMKGVWPELQGNGNFRVWFPKLAKTDREGKLKSSGNDCMNYISADWNTITYDDYKNAQSDMSDKYWGHDLVFAKEPKNDGVYYFRGVYCRDGEESRPNHDVSKRIATRVKVIGKPAREIELLDSIDDQTNWIEKAETITQEVDSSSLTGKEKIAMIKQRVNQGIFRDRLLKKYDRCALCGVSKKDFLIASHIKPWKDAKADEKLDINNGFLLCPNHDKLFDGGYISFSEDGFILLSKEIDEISKTYMNVHEGDRIHISLTEKNRDYLKWHRERVFEQNDDV